MFRRKKLVKILFFISICYDKRTLKRQQSFREPTAFNGTEGQEEEQVGAAYGFFKLPGRK